MNCFIVCLNIDKKIDRFSLFFMYPTVKDETHPACMCGYLSAARIFQSHVFDSAQYTQVRVGFNKFNFDRDTHAQYSRTFYGSSSEASFRRCIWGKFSN